MAILNNQMVNYVKDGTWVTLLVGGLEDGWIMTFHSVGNAIIIPTDFHSIIFLAVG
jgi:hypothetical protein